MCECWGKSDEGSTQTLGNRDQSTREGATVAAERCGAILNDELPCWIKRREPKDGYYAPWCWGRCSCWHTGWWHTCWRSGGWYVCGLTRWRRGCRCHRCWCFSYGRCGCGLRTLSRGSVKHGHGAELKHIRLRGVGQSQRECVNLYERTNMVSARGCASANTSTQRRACMQSSGGDEWPCTTCVCMHGEACAFAARPAQP